MVILGLQALGGACRRFFAISLEAVEMGRLWGML